MDFSEQLRILTEEKKVKENDLVRRIDVLEVELRTAHEEYDTLSQSLLDISARG